MPAGHVRGCTAAAGSHLCCRCCCIPAAACHPAHRTELNTVHPCCCPPRRPLRPPAAPPAPPAAAAPAGLQAAAADPQGRCPLPLQLLHTLASAPAERAAGAAPRPPPQAGQPGRCQPGHEAQNEQGRQARGCRGVSWAGRGGQAMPPGKGGMGSSATGVSCQLGQASAHGPRRQHEADACLPVGRLAFPPLQAEQEQPHGSCPASPQLPGAQPRRWSA